MDANYKVLCGGASLAQDSKDNQFLTSCNVVNSDTPNQWHASAKSVHTSTNATLTAYAIAVYDTTNLLDIKVFQTNTTQSVSHPQATCDVDPAYVRVGGGISTNPSNSNGLMLTASYPSNQTTWIGAAKDHSASCPGTISVYAIGIKWRNPTGKPTLVAEITNSSSPISGNPSSSVGAGGNCALVGGGAFDNYGSGYGNLLTNYLI